MNVDCFTKLNIDAVKGTITVSVARLQSIHDGLRTINRSIGGPINHLVPGGVQNTTIISNISQLRGHARVGILCFHKLNGREPISLCPSVTNHSAKIVDRDVSYRVRFGVIDINPEIVLTHRIHRIGTAFDVAHVQVQAAVSIPCNGVGRASFRDQLGVAH